MFDSKGNILSIRPTKINTPEPRNLSIITDRQGQIRFISQAIGNANLVVEGRDVVDNLFTFEIIPKSRFVKDRLQCNLLWHDVTYYTSLLLIEIFSFLGAMLFLFILLTKFDKLTWIHSALIAIFYFMFPLLLLNVISICVVNYIYLLAMFFMISGLLIDATKSQLIRIGQFRRVRFRNWKKKNKLKEN